MPSAPNSNTATTFHADVAIVGTGIVGLTAAVCLAQLGVHVLLLGPKPASTNNLPANFDSRVFALSHRSQRLLHSLRVWQAMPTERIQAVEAMHIWGDTHTQATAPLRFFAHDAGVQHLSWIIEQHTLSQALCTAANFCPTLQWHPHPLLNLEQSHAPIAHAPAAHPPWRLHTQGGCVQAQVVLAADGAKSQVRQQIGLNFPTHSYSAQGVVATWQCAQPHHGVAHQWFDGDTVLALLPLPGPYVSMVWSMPVHRAQAFMASTASAQTQALASACHGLPQQTLGALQLCSAVHAYPLQHGMAHTWYQQGIALLGDAAHQLHPLAGQGLNIGLEDIAELLQLLQPDTAQGHTNPTQMLNNPALWERWQRQRKADFAPMHHLTHGLHGLFRTHIPGASWLRNQGLAWVGKFPPLKRWLTQHAMR